MTNKICKHVMNFHMICCAVWYRVIKSISFIIQFVDHLPKYLLLLMLVDSLRYKIEIQNTIIKTVSYVHYIHISIPEQNYTFSYTISWMPQSQVTLCFKQQLSLKYKIYVFIHSWHPAKEHCNILAFLGGINF